MHREIERARWRSGFMASEFRHIRGFGRLGPAERQLCAAAAAGEIAFIGRGKAHRLSPPEKASGKAIRPALIRFLALGGGAGLRVHARGVRAVGAWIAGDVDLAGGNVRVPLELEACRVTGTVILTGARLASLRLTRSRVGGVEAADLRVSGDVNLASASFDNRVNFGRARIGSDLDLTGAAIAGLGLASATVGGRLVLRNIRVPRGKKDSISLDGVRAGELVQDEKSAKLFGDVPETPVVPARTRGNQRALLLIAVLLLLLVGLALWFRAERKPAVTEPSPPPVVESKPPIVEPAPPPVVEPRPPIVEPTPPPVVEPKPPIVEPSPPPVVEPKPPAMEQNPPPVVEPVPPPVVEPKPPIVEPTPPPVVEPKPPVVEPSPPPVVEPKPPIVEPTPPPVVEPKPPIVEPSPPPVVEPKPPVMEQNPPPVVEPKPPIMEPIPPPVAEPKPPIVEPAPPPVVEPKPPVMEQNPPPVIEPKPPIVEPTPPPVIEPKPPIAEPSPPPVVEPKPPVVEPTQPPVAQPKLPITGSKPPLVTKPRLRRPAMPRPTIPPTPEYLKQCAEPALRSLSASS